MADSSVCVVEQLTGARVGTQHPVFSTLGACPLIIAVAHRSADKAEGEIVVSPLSMVINPFPLAGVISRGFK